VAVLDLQEMLREFQEARLFFRALVLLAVVAVVTETILRQPVQVVPVAAGLFQIQEAQHIREGLGILQAHHHHKAIVVGLGAQQGAFILALGVVEVQDLLVEMQLGEFQVMVEQVLRLALPDHLRSMLPVAAAVDIQHFQ